MGLNDETGLNKIEEYTFNLYPNPGNNSLNFRTDLAIPVKAIIRDNQGKVVFEETFNTIYFSINESLNNINSGIYFVELISEISGYRLSRKWMKLE